MMLHKNYDSIMVVVMKSFLQKCECVCIRQWRWTILKTKFVCVQWTQNNHENIKKKMCETFE